MVARRSDKYLVNNFPKAAQSRFSPISGPFWVRVGVRVRVRARVRVRGWVGSTPVPLSDPRKCFLHANANSPPPQRSGRPTC